MAELEQGEKIDLNTRVTGGPTIHRDRNVEDAYVVNEHGGELSRDEIKRLAELAGLEVED